MSWRPGAGGGFTTGRPWLPLAPDLETRNVADQAADPASVLSMYRRLIRLRRESQVLLRGDQEVLDVGDTDVLAYVRRADGRSVFVALNFASRAATVRLPVAGTGRDWRVALSTNDGRAEETIGESLVLAPLEACIAYD